MMRFFKSAAVAAWLSVGLATCALAQNAANLLVPSPREVTYFDATFHLDAQTAIVLVAGTDQADAFAANQLAARIEQLSGLKLQVRQEKDASTRSNVILLGEIGRGGTTKKIADRLPISSLMELGDEGYYLQVSDSLVVVLANSSAGLFYGSTSLAALLGGTNPDEIPGMTIYDWPVFRWRGVLCDFRHHQLPNLDTLEQTVRHLSRYKLNTLLLDFGDVFRYASHPKIAAGRGALDKKEVAELETFAARRNVRVIPVIETAGDLPDILNLPEYRELAAFPGSSVLDLGKAETRTFLSEVGFELCEAFSSPYVVVKVSTPLASPAAFAVVRRHLDFVLEMLRKLNKKPILSFDFIRSGLPLALDLPDDALFFQSRHNAEELDFAVAERTLFLLPIADGTSLLPDIHARIFPLQRAARAASEAGAAGFLAAEFSDREGISFEAFQRYGQAFAGACAWSPGSLEPAAFDRAFFARSFGENSERAKMLDALLLDLSDFKWQELWEHPYMLDLTRTDWSRLHRLERRMTLARGVLDSLRSARDASFEQLDYLRFAVMNGQWLVKKYRTVEKIRHFAAHLEDGAATDGASELVNTCLELVEDLNEIVETLQLLWLRSNRSEDVSHFLDLYELQSNYWQEIIEQIHSGNVLFDPRLPSRWIAHPAVSGVDRSHVFFRKTFDLRPGFRKAYLQAIGDTYLKVYVNGAFLDEVISNPGRAWRDRVKMWDVTKALRPGKNVIAVEARNFEGAAAALNLYGEVEYEFGRSRTIASDPYWKTSGVEEQNWQALGFFDIQWLNVQPEEKRVRIIRPEFGGRRPSRIEEE